jgi:hypothetical protein
MTLVKLDGSFFNVDRIVAITRDNKIGPRNTTYIWFGANEDDYFQVNMTLDQVIDTIAAKVAKL